MPYLWSVLALVFLSGCAAGSSTPAPAPPGPGAMPQISLSGAAGGFTLPVHVTHAGDGTGRIFVVEQAGRIRILDNGTVLPGAFLDISAGVACCGEQGLLSAAFPPGFVSKGYFYVNYTRAGDGATVVARYRVSPGTPNAADPASEEILLTVSQPFANHNGGQIAFGPDGHLYIGMGDGGSGGDPLNNAQNPGTLLGKLLRIDPESGAVPYAVPQDNPFVGTPGALPEIWALGLRNPWRFAFDRATGDLYLGDVGQGSFEEIDFQAAGDPGGANYGWKVLEGTECFSSPGCSSAGMTAPVATYPHSPDCSVTGGMVYRGDSLPLQGIYFYGDFCTGRIWGLRRNASGWDVAELLLPQNPVRNVSTFGEDEAGNVYLADYASGDLLKVVAR